MKLTKEVNVTKVRNVESKIMLQTTRTERIKMLQEVEEVNTTNIKPPQTA